MDIKYWTSVTFCGIIESEFGAASVSGLSPSLSFHERQKGKSTMKKVRIGVLGAYRGTSMINYCKRADHAEVVAFAIRAPRLWMPKERPQQV